MKLDRKDIHSLLLGASLYGAGGGGRVEEGLALLGDFESVELLPIFSFHKGCLFASPYACGSLAPKPSRGGEPKELKAARALERYLGQEFAALFPTELGGYNTAVAFHVASELGIPVVDGDAAGRAVPAVHHTLFYLCGIPAWPLAVASVEGDVLIVERAGDDRVLEQLIRLLTEVWGNVGVCDHPVKKDVAIRCLVTGSLTRALEAGACIERGDLAGLLRVSGAQVIHKGTIQQVVWEEKGGFTIGLIRISGGVTIRFKNENCALEGPGFRARMPDIITLIDQNLRPLTNPPPEGKHVCVLVMKADPRWYRRPDIWG